MSELISMNSSVDMLTLPPVSSENNSLLTKILVGLDTTNRNESGVIRSTISQLHDFIKANGLDGTRFMQFAILIAFKRRNHDKSQVGGSGAGEKLLCLETIVAILELGEYDHLIVSVVPLLPRYGCWRDLRQLAVILSRGMVPVNESAELTTNRRPGSSVRALPSSAPVLDPEHESLSVKEFSSKDQMHPVAKLICELFAEQMKLDNSMDSATPSNACKYAPHEHRSKGGRSAKSNEEHSLKRRRDVDTSETEPADKKPKSSLNAINSILSKEIERVLCPGLTNESSAHAAYRKIRSGLNRRLVSKGHLIEPIICQGSFNDIDFIKANKAAITKRLGAIKKRPDVCSKWKSLMKSDIRAVNDIDSMYEAVTNYLEEVKASESDPVFPLRINKAIKTAAASRKALIDKAQKMLQTTTPSEDKTTELPFDSEAVGIIVDTTGCSSMSSALTIILAGYISACSLNERVIVVNGSVRPLFSEVLGEVIDWHAFCNELNLQVLEFQSSANEWNIGTLRHGVEALLEAHAVNPSLKYMDVVIFCYKADHYNEAQDQFLETVAMYQSVNSLNIRLRTLRLHRVKHAISTSEGSISYSPRVSRPDLLPEQQTADVVFIVDFTGSMGSYMSSVKTELKNIINALKESSGIASVRVALVGYRDYEDEDRVVRCDFHSMDSLDSLLEIINVQQASGGGDEPEDLLSGLVCAKTLSWESALRLAVIITDAEAHGFTTNDDRFKSGRCPDQTDDGYPDLTEAATHLAVDLRVDTFFCRMRPTAMKTETALQEVYQEIGGFGVIGLNNGANSLRDQVIAGLGTAIAASMVNENVSGLQTFDGETLSSIQSSLNASLRESLKHVSSSEGENELEDPKPLTDFERLVNDLRSDHLAPVRAALQLNLGTLNEDSLAERAALKLLQSGVTAAELEELNYPAPLLKLLHAAAVKSLAKI